MLVSGVLNSSGKWQTSPTKKNLTKKIFCTNVEVGRTNIVKF